MKVIGFLDGNVFLIQNYEEFPETLNKKRRFSQKSAKIATLTICEKQPK